MIDLGSDLAGQAYDNFILKNNDKRLLILMLILKVEYLVPNINYLFFAGDVFVMLIHT